MTQSDEIDDIRIPGARGEYVRLRSGARAHYVTAGSSGPPVILLHGGLPGSSGSAGWRLMLPALAEAGLRVYAPDRPGFGAADTRQEHHPVRGHLSWVDFVVEFADALCLDTFGLGGNSQGAQVAANVAVLHPERVTRLALIATSGFNTVLDIDPAALVPGIGFPRFEGTEASMRTMMSTIIRRTDAVTDELVRARTRAALRQEDAFAAAAAWNRRAAAEPDLAQLLRLQGRLDRLTMPIVYLYGRQDVLGPVENAYLQEDCLPNVQFFYPDDCGHQGQTDQPEIFNQVFAEFFCAGRVSRATAEKAGVSGRRPPLATVVGG